MMMTIEISQPVWDAIATRGKFGESVDDVLRREFDLPPVGPDELGPVLAKSNSAAGGQNAATGRRGYKKGKSEAARAAEYLGAEKAADGKGNEYLLNGERLLFKWAKYANGRIGIYDGHMDRINFIIGVLETSDGSRELWKTAASVVAPHMERSHVHNHQGQLNKNVLRQHGELIATLNGA